MTDQDSGSPETIVIQSSRFGALRVPKDAIIELPSGIIGFPRFRKYVMLDHKPPFSWLHSVDNDELAFVVVDGFQFGTEYDLVPPVGDKDCDFREDDEYAILVIVTVRPDPKLTTANLKAPIFVNLRNRRGVQIIFDDPRYSTRFHIYGEPEMPGEGDPEPKGGDK